MGIRHERRIERRGSSWTLTTIFLTLIVLTSFMLLGLTLVLTKL